MWIWKTAPTPAPGRREGRSTRVPDERRLNLPLSLGSNARAQAPSTVAVSAADGQGLDKTMRVDWILLDDPASGALRVGDLVSAEAGGLPTYRILDLRDGRAWLRDEAHNADLISPVGRFRWKAAPSAP